MNLLEVNNVSKTYGSGEGFSDSGSVRQYGNDKNCVATVHAPAKRIWNMAITATINAL